MEQLDFPFPMNQEKLTEFLGKWLALEEEQDRLREETRLLKESFSDDLPMRGLVAAIKIVRTTHKLEQHPKGMARKHLAYLAALVEKHMTQQEGTPHA